MSRGIRGILITLIVAGLALAAIGFLSGGSTSLYIDDNWHVIVPARERQRLSFEANMADLKRLDVNLSTADVKILSGTGDRATVEADFPKGLDVVCTLKDGVLHVGEEGTRHSILSLGFFNSNARQQRVTVTLAQGSYEAALHSGVGTIQIEDISPTALNVDCGSGTLSMHNVSSASTQLFSGTGSVSLVDSRLGSLNLKNGTGTVTAQGTTCDTAKISVNTGSTTLKAWASGGLQMRGGTGRIHIEGDLTGETRVEGGTGSIMLATTRGADAYHIDADTGTGSVDVPEGNPMAANGIYLRNGTGSITLHCGQ